MEPVAALILVFFISLTVPSSFKRTGLLAAIAPSAVAVIVGAASIPVKFAPLIAGKAPVSLGD